MIKDDDIQVYDGLFSKSLISRIEEKILTSPWLYGETSTPDNTGPRHWVTHLSGDTPEVSIIYCAVEKYLRKIGNFDLMRVYCNAHVHSDLPLPHKDSDNPRNRTILYYANSNWQKEFSGETVFFYKGEIVKSVLPKPGRVVIFNSAIEHCARVPSRHVDQLRLTVAFKMIRKK